jgi:hypothetical protein
MALARFLEGTAFAVLNDFLSTFNTEDGGYAVPNRFEVLITRPGTSANENRQVSMRCESINLPGRNLNSATDTNIYGPTREIVDGVTYAEDISMTFQASSGLEERTFFEDWQSLAFDERSWNVGYYNDYISTVDIYILDRQNQRRFGLKLHEAFPKTIGATELSQAANNELIKLAVTFSFRYWTTLDVERQRPSLSEKIFDTITTGVERQISSNLPKVFTRLF